MRRLPRCIFFICVFFITIPILTSCGSKKTSTDILVESKYKNDIFNKNLYQSLLEIDYWNADTKIIINNKSEMDGIYSQLASLVLKEEPIDIGKEGGIWLELISKESKLHISLFSNDIYVNGKRYVVDKNVADAIMNIAIKNK